MPTYVYKCPECGHVWEEFQVPIEKRNEQVCPRLCKKDGGDFNLSPPAFGEIQIQAVPTVFKAMGFPSNDIKKNESDSVAKIQNEAYRNQYKMPA